MIQNFEFVIHDCVIHEHDDDPPWHPWVVRNQVLVSEENSTGKSAHAFLEHKHNTKQKKIGGCVTMATFFRHVLVFRAPVGAS